MQSKLILIFFMIKLYKIVRVGIENIGQGGNLFTRLEATCLKKSLKFLAIFFESKQFSLLIFNILIVDDLLYVLYPKFLFVAKVS